MKMNPHDFDIGQAVDLGPCSVKIDNDPDAESPWESWDCMTPLAWLSLTGGGVTAWDSGDGILTPLDTVPPAWASRHWRALCDILRLDPQDHDSDARENADYHGGLSDSRLALFQERLQEMESFYWGPCSDHFDALAAIWKLRGVPALTFQRNGYSQGDSVLGLLVETPEHAARCGYDPKKPGHDVGAGLEGAANLFGAWAFGDIYGFTIENSHGEHVDSCWGFYGSPWGNNPESGDVWAVLEGARDSLAYQAPHMAAQAQAQAQDKRAAYLALKGESKAAQAQGVAGPRLCATVRDALRTAIEEWRTLARDARAWARLARELKGESNGV